ncbi:MAG: glycosyltransferase family 4 protein [Proteobacteria bacterium]|nr:glycosyltransferase family 4 protein [Pseudomonadota bacterium]
MSRFVPSSDPSAKPVILQVIPSLDTGGAERTTLDVAAALVREGFTALVASRGGRLEKELADSGAELVRLNAASKSPRVMLSNVLVLRDLIRKRNVSLVHARSRAPAWSALSAASMADVPFVTTYHGIYNAGNPLKRFYNSVMIRADAVIANSQWTADHIAREYRRKPKRLVVIPRGVDLVTFDPAAIPPDNVAALRAKWGVTENDFVALLPGRLTRWKGQGVLIEAMALLKEKGTLGNARAIFAGDSQGRDDYEKELRAKIEQTGLSEHALIVGHVSDMATAYAASDVVISASTDPEAFGRVAAEGSAMAKPVIASDHGGARETVLTNVSGFLVPPGDARALAAALEKVIVTPPHGRVNMGMAGRAHIIRNYSRERMCSETIALYRSLIPA